MVQHGLPRPGAAEYAAHARMLRVLVADDVPDTVISLLELLRDEGHEARGVYTGLDVLNSVRDFAPDAVLLDIGMPHINGYDLAPLLRQALAPRKVPIIAVTAWGSQKDRDHSRALGFVEHILKPPPMDMVRDTIERFCAPAGA